MNSMWAWACPTLCNGNKPGNPEICPFQLVDTGRRRWGLRKAGCGASCQRAQCLVHSSTVQGVGSRPPLPFYSVGVKFFLPRRAGTQLLFLGRLCSWCYVLQTWSPNIQRIGCSWASVPRLFPVDQPRPGPSKTPTFHSPLWDTPQVG